MVRFIKFFIYSILILFVILVFLAIFLSKIGLETKRFNPLIIEQVKKYNENLNLDINKVKIYISIDSLTNTNQIDESTNQSTTQTSSQNTLAKSKHVQPKSSNQPTSNSKPHPAPFTRTTNKQLATGKTDTNFTN